MNLPTYLLGISIAWIVALIVFYRVTTQRGSLTGGGALAACVLATVIALCAGPAWLLPMLVFFGSSVLIGKVCNNTSHEAADAKHAQARDATQVLANGGWYAAASIIHLLLSGDSPCLPLPTGAAMLSVAACVTADTWSSEVGQYYRQPTFDILRWRRVPPGLSGGISVAGTVAGAGGGLLIAALSPILLPGAPAWSLILGITVAGFLGMLIDSLLGATLQARYRDEGGKLTDRRLPNAWLYSGFPFVSNDLVNFAATVLIWLVSVALLGYL